MITSNDNKRNGGKCVKCGFMLGEFSANRSIKLHKKIICGDCAQKANPEYHAWLKEKKLMKKYNVLL